MRGALSAARQLIALCILVAGIGLAIAGALTPT
jgi:hypothetical protein